MPSVWHRVDFSKSLSRSGMSSQVALVKGKTEHAIPLVQHSPADFHLISVAAIFLALAYASDPPLLSLWPLLLSLPGHTGFFAFLQISIHVPIPGSLHVLFSLPWILYSQISTWLTPLLSQIFAQTSYFSERYPLTSVYKKNHDPCLLPMSLCLVLWTECLRSS